MSIRFRLRTLVAIGLLAVLSFGGYAAWFHLWPGSSRVEAVAGDPHIFVWQQRSGMDAEFQGVLGYDPATGCLFLEDGQGGRWGLVWPMGSRPVTQDGRRGVRVDAFIGRVGGTVVRADDRLRLGGGGADRRQAEPLIAAGCAYDGVLIVHSPVRHSGA